MSASRKTSWVAALSALYGPTLLPLAGIGPLNECPHCVRIYLFWTPALPGALLASPLRAIAPWMHALAALAIAIAAAWVLAHAWQRLPLRASIPVLAAIAVLAAMNALAFAAALRT